MDSRNTVLSIAGAVVFLAGITLAVVLVHLAYAELGCVALAAIGIWMVATAVDRMRAGRRSAWKSRSDGDDGIDESGAA